MLNTQLIAKITPVKEITISQIEEMHTLFNRYYDNAEFKQFKTDLLDKDHVIILYKKGTPYIKGFSTIKTLNTMVNGKKVRGMYSGDTVVDKEFWGQGTLGNAFLKHLFLEKCKKPLTPLYWFLISKGHKTYLLMANNFVKHYPRYEARTPVKVQEIIHSFASGLFSKHYNVKTGIIHFNNKDKDCLKTNVAPITAEMVAKNKRIAFFAKTNKNWFKGDELACVAEMTFLLPFQYLLKTLSKNMKRYIEHSKFSSSEKDLKEKV